jgi:hypothetical protein
VLDTPRSILVAAAAGATACSSSLLDPPADSGPTVAVVWDPRVCAGDPRREVTVSLEASSGALSIATSPCAACELDLIVGHVGWYIATFSVDDRDIADTTLAVDAPLVEWTIPWP